MADIMMEISAEMDRIEKRMRKTSDPAILEGLRKDMAMLKDEYRHEVRAYYGLED